VRRDSREMPDQLWWATMKHLSLYLNCKSESWRLVWRVSKQYYFHHQTVGIFIVHVMRTLSFIVRTTRCNAIDS
jgi:hypothetical protein